MAKRYKTTKLGKRKWYELDPKKHGISGLSPYMPKPRKQDRRAKAWEGYSVVFFPQYRLGWKAHIGYHDTLQHMSQTPEAARVRFADKIGGDKSPAQKWKNYYRAGHRVRKIKIIDMGPA